MLLAQITDFHVARPGSQMATTARTAERLAQAVRHINALAPRPDAVVCTGDLADSGSESEYRDLLELLASLAYPTYVIPGNHDDRDNLRRAFRERGHAYLPEVGPLCYTVDLGPLRLVALDTLVPGAAHGELDAEALAWLDARLAESKVPTIILQHHPPFRTGIGHMDAMGLEGSDAEAAVVRKYDHVERILCGHLHRSISCRFAGTVASTCPSTAHQVGLDLGVPGGLSIVAEPPVCALHLFSDGTLVSHTSYINASETMVVLASGMPQSSSGASV